MGSAVLKLPFVFAIPMLCAFAMKGRGLLMISNQAEQPTVESIPLAEVARVGGDGLEYFYDAETGEEIEAAANVLKLFIPAQDYRVVIGFPTPWPFAAKNALGESDLPAQSTLDPEDTLTAISKQLLTSRTLQPVPNADRLYEDWMARVLKEIPADSSDVVYLDAKACGDIPFGQPGIQCSIIYDKKHNASLISYYNTSDKDVRLPDQVRTDICQKAGQTGHQFIIHPVTGISEWAFVDIPSHRGLLEICYPDTQDFWNDHNGPFLASNMLANMNRAIASRQKEMGGRQSK